MANLSSSLEHLMKQIGKECIYKEGGLILHAELLAINIKADMLELIFKKIKSQGFTERDIHEFTCSGKYEYVNFNSNRIYISMVNIEIFLKKEQVDAIKKMMTDKTDVENFITMLRKFRRDH